MPDGKGTREKRRQIKQLKRYKEEVDVIHDDLKNKLSGTHPPECGCRVCSARLYLQMASSLLYQEASHRTGVNHGS
jgi:hypothetical protein